MSRAIRCRTLETDGAARCVSALATAMVLFAAAGPVLAQPEQSPEIQAAIARGAEYLRAHGAQPNLGEEALMVLAMIKCGVDPADPGLAPRLQRIRGSVAGPTFDPGEEHYGLYTAGIVAMVLGALNRAGASDQAFSREGMEKISKYVIAHQNPNGSWNYPSFHGGQGDTSVTQYAMLALWEAVMAGVEVPPEVFDKAAAWHIQAQDAEKGGYGYRPLGGGSRTVSHTMTAGALGSLMICLQRGPTAKPVLKHKLLIPVTPEGDEPAEYVPTTSAAEIRRAIARADGWLTNAFDVEKPTGLGHYYFFYALERYGSLAESDDTTGEPLRSIDWYHAVAERLLRDQRADGGWTNTFGVLVDTSFALLFLSRATKKTVEEYQEPDRLGKGILVGGRGLPQDFTQVVVDPSGFKVKPLQGSLDELLGMLRTASGMQLEGARVGLYETLRQSDPATLKLGIERLEELAEVPEAQTRQIAVWALARQESLRVAPTLIRALNDPDPGVRGEAQAGLQLLRRRFPGPIGGSADGEAAPTALTKDDWIAWYRALDPTWRWTQP